MAEQASARPALLSLETAVRRCSKLVGRNDIRHAADLERTVKSLAKRLAQRGASPVTDRRMRAQLRTHYYNQLSALLNVLTRGRVSERLHYRRLLLFAYTLVAPLCVLTGALLGWWLSIA